MVPWGVLSTPPTASPGRPMGLRKRLRSPSRRRYSANARRRRHPGRRRTVGKWKWHPTVTHTASVLPASPRSGLGARVYTRAAVLGSSRWTSCEYRGTDWAVLPPLGGRDGRRPGPRSRRCTGRKVYVGTNEDRGAYSGWTRPPVQSLVFSAEQARVMFTDASRGSLTMPSTAVVRTDR